LDLLDPTEEEEKSVEELLGTNIPTKAEMQEIELSSRLYQKNDSLHLTATVVTKADTPEPESSIITFVLVGERLVTVRYLEHQSFRLFLERGKQLSPDLSHGSLVLTGLLDAIIDRMADILESVGHNMDGMTRLIFRPSVQDKAERARTKPDFEEMLRQIAINGDLTSKARESLVSITRLLSFASQSSYFKPSTEESAKIHVLMRDILPLSDHATFLSNKVNFLLEATLGMIDIEQNAIIKIFSVAAVVFLPPTLVASIYGMNFDFMPELKWPFGYPLALVLMVLSSYLPYKYFKRQQWL
jgi:magnesium transporter